MFRVLPKGPPIFGNSLLPEAQDIRKVVRSIFWGFQDIQIQAGSLGLKNCKKVPCTLNPTLTYQNLLFVGSLQIPY